MFCICCDKQVISWQVFSSDLFATSRVSRKPCHGSSLAVSASKHLIRCARGLPRSGEGKPVRENPGELNCLRVGPGGILAHDPTSALARRSCGSSPDTGLPRKPDSGAKVDGTISSMFGHFMQVRRCFHCSPYGLAASLCETLSAAGADANPRDEDGEPAGVAPARTRQSVRADVVLPWPATTGLPACSSGPPSVLSFHLGGLLLGLSRRLILSLESGLWEPPRLSISLRETSNYSGDTLYE